MADSSVNKRKRLLPDWMSWDNYLFLPSHWNWNIDSSWVLSLLACELKLRISHWLSWFSGLYMWTGTGPSALQSIQLVSGLIVGLLKLHNHIDLGTMFYNCSERIFGFSWHRNEWKVSQSHKAGSPWGWKSLNKIWGSRHITYKSDSVKGGGSSCTEGTRIFSEL